MSSDLDLVNIKITRQTRRALNILAAQCEVPVAVVVAALVQRPGIAQTVAAALRDRRQTAQPPRRRLRQE